MQRQLFLYPLLAIAFTLCSVRAAEGPVDDAIKLAKAGLSDEVLTAWVDSLPAYNPLSTDAILALKNAQVPEKMIAAMVRKGSVTVQPSQPGAASGVRTYDAGTTARPYTTEDATRYVYSQPATANVVYADYTPTVTYASSYYPYRSSYYYPATCYPSYGYYGYRAPYYGSYYGSRLSIGFGWGGSWGGSWGHSHWGGRCR